MLLFVWPGAWGLPSIDVECLAAVAQLQLYHPNKFSICECTSTNESPDGRLPFLKVGSKLIPSCDIPQYILSQQQNDNISNYNNNNTTDILAYTSLAFDSLTDLLHHSLFSLPQNYLQTTRPAIAASLSIPQKWIYPGQLRSSYQPRLELKKLWGLGGDADHEETQERNSKFSSSSNTQEDFMERSWEKRKKFVDDAKNSFDKKKIIQFARNTLDPFSTKLGEKDYFYGESASILDAVVASHLIIFISAPLPQPMISDLLKTDYPNLIKLSQRIQGSLLNSDNLTIVSLSTSSSSYTSSFFSLTNTISSSLFSLKTFFLNNHSNKSHSASSQQKQKRFARKRLFWFLGVSITFASYMFILPMLITMSKNRNRRINGTISMDDDDDEEEEEEEEYEDDDD